MTMDIFTNTVLPAVLQVLGAVLAALLTWAATKAKTKWGIDIEARHREALHSALMTAVQAALSRGATMPQAVEAALDYAPRSVPDAMKALQPSADLLRELATAKVAGAIGRAAAS